VRLCFAALLLLAPAVAPGAEIPVAGLREPVEILRDRWGVPHIYARNTTDLFFAQGYVAAMDRLWQIDLWRRMGTGKRGHVLLPAAWLPHRRAVRGLPGGEPPWPSACCC
jgi:penicillin amidase